jgi:hypothetical protein
MSSVNTEKFTDDEINWMVHAINNQIKYINNQSRNFNESEAFKHRLENDGYVAILKSAKEKLI